MEGSSSNFTQTDIPESSCLCKRKQPEGTAADPITIDDDNQRDNTTLCTCRNHQEMSQSQGRTNEVPNAAQGSRNVRLRMSMLNPSHQPTERLYPVDHYIPPILNMAPVLPNLLFHPTLGYSYDFLVGSIAEAASNNGITMQDSHITPLENVPFVSESIGVIESLAPNLVPRLQQVINSYRQGMINLHLATGTIEVLRARAAVQSMVRILRQEGQDLVRRIRIVKRKGLSEEDIQARMERHVFNNNGSTEEVGTCCVCMEDFCNNDEIGKLDCAHQFHYDCIKKWLKEKNSCPMCKRIALVAPRS